MNNCLMNNCPLQNLQNLDSNLVGIVVSFINVIDFCSFRLIKKNIAWRHKIDENVKSITTGHNFEYKTIHLSTLVMPHWIKYSMTTSVICIALKIPSSIGWLNGQPIIDALGNAFHYRKFSRIQSLSVEYCCSSPHHADISQSFLFELYDAVKAGCLSNLKYFNLIARKWDDIEFDLMGALNKFCPELQRISFESIPIYMILHDDVLSLKTGFLNQNCWHNITHLDIGNIYHRMIGIHNTDDEYAKQTAFTLINLFTKERFPSVNSISIRVEYAKDLINIFLAIIADWYGNKVFFGSQITILDIDLDTVYLGFSFDSPETFRNELKELLESLSLSLSSFTSDHHSSRGRARRGDGDGGRMKLPIVFPNVHKLSFHHWVPFFQIFDMIRHDSGGGGGGEGLDLEVCSLMEDPMLCTVIRDKWHHEALPLRSVTFNRRKKKVDGVHAHQLYRDIIAEEGKGHWRNDVDLFADQHRLDFFYNNEGMVDVSDYSWNDNISPVILYAINNNKFRFLRRIQVYESLLWYIAFGEDEDRALRTRRVKRLGRDELPRHIFSFPLHLCSSLQHFGVIRDYDEDDDRSAAVDSDSDSCHDDDNISHWSSIVEWLFASISITGFPSALELLELEGFQGEKGRKFLKQIRSTLSRYFAECRHDLQDLKVSCRNGLVVETVFNQPPVKRFREEDTRDMT